MHSKGEARTPSESNRLSSLHVGREDPCRTSYERKCELTNLETNKIGKTLPTATSAIRFNQLLSSWSRVETQQLHVFSTDFEAAPGKEGFFLAVPPERDVRGCVKRGRSDSQDLWFLFSAC
jgi:hypothetical protein